MNEEIMDASTWLWDLIEQVADYSIGEEALKQEIEELNKYIEKHNLPIIVTGDLVKGLAERKRAEVADFDYYDDSEYVDSY
jgi:uncharacterized protein (DUF2342 family)